MDESPSQLSAPQRIDALWKVIGRYDTYIGSTNTKAGFLIAFNTFVPGSVVLKWKDIQDAFGPNHAQEFVVASVFLYLAMATSVASLVFTFWAVFPYVWSPKEKGKYDSNIFYGSVAKLPLPDDYHARLLSISESELVKDLAFQAHTLAKALSGKFLLLKIAVRVILFGELPLFLLAIVTYAVALLR